MARVTNAHLAQRIDDLTEAFKEFKGEVQGQCQALNGRQRGLVERVAKLESRGNPGNDKETSRLEDPKVLLILVAVIQGLIGVIGVLALLLQG